jgi:hypothetical protein
MQQEAQARVHPNVYVGELACVLRFARSAVKVKVLRHFIHRPLVTSQLDHAQGNDCFGCSRVYGAPALNSLVLAGNKYLGMHLSHAWICLAAKVHIVLHRRDLGAF